MTDNFNIITDEFIQKYKDKKPNWGFNGLGYIVYKRTYARIIEENSKQTEEWHQTLQRCINGAQKIGAQYTKEEAERLYDLMFNLKCSFAGRMLWQLGTSTVDRFGANSLLNCWFTTIEKIEDFCFIFENLMLGGGVGFSVKREHVHELPKVKENVTITVKDTKDADFIIPDSREGWVELLHKVLESYFITGKSFTYSTILLRGYGELIRGFGGTASGPKVLVEGISNICGILEQREGKKIRSIDALDICNIIGSVVVAGNVRRSALIAIGDPDDMLFIKAKRWDLGGIPNWRSMSNNSVYADSYDHIMENVWDGYGGNGEPYGFINLDLSRKVGRLGEKKKDMVEGFNPCFVGDTLVAVADGRNAVTIKQLADENWTGPIYTSNDEGKVVIGNCSKVWKTRENAEIIEIILDDNSSFKCTPDHKIMLRNGEYKMAKDLQENDSLKPFNSYENNKYRQIVSNTKRDRRQYRMVAEYYGLLDNLDPKLYAVHHKDFNNKNDAIENLQVLTHIEHTELHAVGMRGKNNAVFRIKDRDKWRKKLSEAGRGHRNPNSHGLTSEEMVNHITNLSVKEGRNVFYKEILESLNMKNISSGRLKDFCEILNLSQDTSLKDICLNIAKNNNLKIYNHLKTAKREKFINHKVKSIKILSEKQDVYDLTVDDTHNFAIITSNKDELFIESSGVFVHNCAEISLHRQECCDLAEIFLNNISNKAELLDCAKLLYKTQKAILALPFLHKETELVVRKNMRIGASATGICQVDDEKLNWLDDTYTTLKKFDVEWSKKNGWNESIKLTCVKPSGTLSLLAGSTPGIHPAFSRHYIRRVRMSSSDPLVSLCRKHGYYVEFVRKFDGSNDHSTVVVEFPCTVDEKTITAAQMSAIKQLELVKKLQTIWADNAVSVTVYYKKEELPEIRQWLKTHYKTSIKSVSFLLHSEHGFDQAPYEQITEDVYNKIVARVKSIEQNSILNFSDSLDGLECEGGACPIK